MSVLEPELALGLELAQASDSVQVSALESVSGLASELLREWERASAREQGLASALGPATASVSGWALALV